jgi:hypothetical protein
MGWKIVLIDQTTDKVVPPGQLQQIATALQQQVDNDFAPAWGVRADISAPAAGDAIPPDAWQVNVVDSLPGPGEDGVHQVDDQGNPYAAAVKGAGLSVTISHEVLEMLVDPWGNRFTRAPDIDSNFPNRQVFYLVEVGDPCETSDYPIDGVQVSDFVRPSFYDPNGVAPFDFLNTLAGPLKVAKDCYISWFDPADGKWHRLTGDGGDGIIVTGKVVTPGRNPREDRDKAFDDGVN